MNWGLKYRPKSYQEIALHPNIRKLFDEAIKNQHMGDFLFYSPTPGCGKTTLAKIIPELFDLEPLFINASKNGNMETIRNDITKFMNFASIEASGKLVILDEAENITQTAQESLRGMLEEDRFKHLHFIFTVNDKSRLIEPISNSRLLPLDFSLPKFDLEDKSFLISVLSPTIKYLESILLKNNIDYNKKDLLELVKEEYPSIRRMVVKMEFSIFNNKFEPSLYGTKEILTEDEIIKALKNNKKDELYLLSQSFNNLDFFIDYIQNNLIKLIKIDDFAKTIELLNIYQNNKANNLTFNKINGLDLLYKLTNIKWN